MLKFKNIYILFLLIVFLFTNCAVKQNNRHANYEYRNLLIYNQTPREVYGHLCEGGFMQFQIFEQAERDTIVILKFNRRNRFEFYRGISVGENYERFREMNVIKYNDKPFFAVRSYNSGNAKGNRLNIFYIEEQDCTLHPVKICEAYKLYLESLPDSLFIWNDEIISYNDNLITSEFFIWKKNDIHPYPTGGKVSVIYDIEQTGKQKYKLYPKEMNFEEGTFELSK